MKYPETLNLAWRDHLAPRKQDAPTFVSLFAGCGGSSLGYSMAGFQELLAVERDDHAVEVFRLNFPDVPVYHGDIARLSVEQCMKTAGVEEGDLDVLDGSPPCFPAGTPVATPQGAKAVETIKAGDLILTHTGRYRRVEKTFSREYEGELAMIEPRYGRSDLTCTPNHPLLVKRVVCVRQGYGFVKTYSEPQWINAGEVSSGDLLLEPAVKAAIPLNIPPVIDKQRINRKGAGGVEASENVLKERACDIDWRCDAVAWTLGLYLAEGHLRGRDPVLATSGACRRSIIFSVRDAKAKTAAKKMRQAGFNPYVQKHGQGVTRLTITDTDYWVLCRTMGQYAHGKFIPSAFLTMSKSWREALLAGYLFGDGYTRAVKGTTIISAVSVSKRLIQGIAQLVAGIYNVVPSIETTRTKPTTVICGREVNQRDYYTMRCRISAVDEDKERLGHVDEQGVWIPIRRVQRTVPVRCRVFNLEVERDHSYTAHGFAAHNCQGFSTAGRRAFTDQRNSLFMEFVRLLRGLMPKVFVMENVSGLVKGKMKLIFRAILQELKASGYRVSVRLLNASHYGVPQLRERVIFIGVRNDLGIHPSHPVGRCNPISLREALYNCEPSEIMPLTGRNLKMLSMVRPGAKSTERNKAAVAAFGKVRNFNLLKLSWSKPSPTVLKSMRVSGDFGSGLVMPDEDRYVSISELKRICSFPDQFQMTGTYVEKWGRLGNSVPPLLMKFIIDHIKTHVLERK